MYIAYRQASDIRYAISDMQKMAYRKLKTHKISLRGPRVRLRPLTEDDWDLLLKWNNDPTVLYYSEEDDVHSWSLRELREMYRATSRIALLFIIEVKAERKERKGFPSGWKPIGDAWLEEMNLQHWLKRYPKKDMRRLPVFIGEKDEWGKGYGGETIGLLLELAFEEGAELVFACGIWDYNQRCLRAFEKHGFKVVRKKKAKWGAKGKFLVDMVLAGQEVEGQKSEAGTRKELTMSDAKDNQGLLKLYDGLRVADVRDGMDWMMQHKKGSMSPDIRPLWRTHAIGIARTARYLPYDGEVPQMSPEEYSEWVGKYYGEICTYPFMDVIQPGDFVVIDADGVDAGLMGSNNTLDGKKKGAAGYVSSGGVRDTDEVIAQGIPFWSKLVSQSMVQGRLKYDAMDVPVQVGGVEVEPGDVVVADGDGVIVVPRGIAPDVAKWARREYDADKTARREKYHELGMELDDSVR